MARVEAVVGNKDHGGIRGNQLQQTRQHHVVKAVRALDNPFIRFEKIVGDAGKLRRVKVHEAVTEMIDAGVIDRREIPGLMFQCPRCGIVNRAGFRQDFGKHA